LQIDRVDRFRIGLGIEAPIVAIENAGDAGADFVISPIAEYILDIPVNRQGYSCLFLPGPGPPTSPCPERTAASTGRAPAPSSSG